jgi:hypothetical protein
MLWSRSQTYKIATYMIKCIRDPQFAVLVRNFSCAPVQLLAIVGTLIAQSQSTRAVESRGAERCRHGPSMKGILR